MKRQHHYCDEHEERELRPQKEYLVPPPRPEDHPYLRPPRRSRFHHQAKMTGFTNEAAKYERQKEEIYHKGVRRHRQKHLAQLQLSQQIEPDELQTIFDENLTPPEPNPLKLLVPGLPGLARKLAKEKIESPIPSFDLPRIRFDNSLTLQTLVDLAEARVDAPFQHLWVVCDRDQHHQIQLVDLLDQLTEEHQTDYDKIYLVRRGEFDFQKDRIVEFINDQFTKAYSDHFKGHYHSRYNHYINKLETHLSEAAASISKSEAQNMRLRTRNNELRRQLFNLEQASIEFLRELREASCGTTKTCSEQESISGFESDTFAEDDVSQPASAPKPLINMQHENLSAVDSPPEREVSPENASTVDALAIAVDGRLPNVNPPPNRDIHTTSPLDEKKFLPEESSHSSATGRLQSNSPPNCKLNSRPKNFRSSLFVDEEDDEKKLPQEFTRPKTFPNLEHSLPCTDFETAFTSDEEYDEKELLEQLVLVSKIQSLMGEHPDSNPKERKRKMAPISNSRSAKASKEVWGEVVDQDEVGPIFDYSELTVGMRGGAGNRDELREYNHSRSKSNSNGLPPIITFSNNDLGAGILQRLQQLQEDDDDIDFSLPTTFNGVPIPIKSPAEASYQKLSNQSGRESYDSKNHNGGRARGNVYHRRRDHRDHFASGLGDLKLPNSNEQITGFEYFRPLQNDNLPTGLRTKLDEDDSCISPLHLTLGNVSNAAPMSGSENLLITSARTNINNIEPIIHARALQNDELHLAKKPRTQFERDNSQYVSHNTGAIVFDIGGKSHIWEPKRDKRLENIDDHGNYLGGENNRPKKRLLIGLRQQIRERHRQLLEKSADYRFFCNLSKEKRAEIWAKRNRPLQFWKGKPGAASDDQIEVDRIPKQYIKVYKKYLRRSHATSKARSKSMQEEVRFISRSSTVTSKNTKCTPSHSSALSNTSLFVRDDFVAFDDTSSNYTSASTRCVKKNDFRNRRASEPCFNISNAQGLSSKQLTLRSDEEIERLIRELCQDVGKFPMPGSVTSRLPSTGGDSYFSASGASPEGNVFEILDDEGPELQMPQDTSDDLNSRFNVPQKHDFDSDQYQEALKVIEKEARAVLITLHSGPFYTPNSICRRVFGGIIQEIQLHEKDRRAVVIFLYPAEARGFVDHIQKVKENGTYQEISALQINAEWYKESIIPPQPNILRQALFSEATRSLCLSNISLSVTRERICSELGIRLNKLLISIILVTPKQRYKQASNGRQAIIEFAAIKDAIEAKQALLEGKIDEYENCSPEYAADPAVSSENYVYKGYCKCLTCEECRGVRLEGTLTDDSNEVSMTEQSGSSEEPVFSVPEDLYNA